MAAFASLCSMSGEITQNYNHNANQTTCFQDQITIWAKMWCRRLHVSMNLCCLNWMINITIKQQMEAQTCDCVCCCFSAFIYVVLWVLARMKCCFSSVYPCGANTNVMMFTTRLWSSSSVTPHLKHVCGVPGRAMHLFLKCHRLNGHILPSTQPSLCVCLYVMFQLPFSPCLSSQNSGLWPWLQMKQRMFGWVRT